MIVVVPIYPCGTADMDKESLDNELSTSMQTSLHALNSVKYKA